MSAPERRLTWSSKWPRQSGTYLFFGVPHTVELKKASLQAVHVHEHRLGQFIYLGTDILYPQEWRGVWAPLDVELPDLEKLLGAST